MRKGTSESLVGRALGAAVKTPFATLTFQFRVPGFQSQLCSYFQLPALAGLRR